MSAAPASGLRRWWRRQQFVPGRLGWLANPYYFARRELLAGVREFAPRLGDEVVDVGCGRKPYREFVPCSRYVGLEIDTPANRAAGTADAYYAGERFPFDDASFDGALCSQVLEHVFTPEEFLRELHRVLRPGGHLLLTVPFAWDEHEQPRDFARYSSFGLKALLERTGFEVLAARKSTPGARALFQLAGASLHKATLGSSRVMNLLAMLLLVAPVNLAGLLLGRLLPASADFYLDNVVLARRVG